jgi:hypothetical protein
LFLENTKVYGQRMKDTDLVMMQHTNRINTVKDGNIKEALMEDRQLKLTNLVTPFAGQCRFVSLSICQLELPALFKDIDGPNIEI